MKPLAPNTILQERYLINRIIGKGGMGEVYLATDKRLGNKVALKRTTVGDDAMLAVAFENEARTLAALRHPVLPNVTDHFLENDEQFLVMDYIEGEDLSERLKETNKPFPTSWVMYWADQLLEALAYLHSNNPPIIHRDIKPQNLKLTADNQIVLLDFGLSKNSVGQTKVTTSGSVVGYTPHYAPMEQIRGTGTNAKSDIYALSATLYQLLTNTVPPDALTRADSLLANLPDPLRPLGELSSEVSGEISDTIMKGMNISQDRRFESAREMQKRLRRAFNSMRESMSAKTVAFNVEESDATPVTDAPVSFDTNVPLAPPPLETAETDSTGDISGEKTEVFSAEEAAVPPGVVPPIVNQEPEGEKTEVLLDHVLGVTPETPPPDAPTGFETDEGFEFEETSGETGTGFETNDAPDATVPLIDLGVESESEEFEGSESETEAVPDVAAAAAVQASPVAVPAKKKGGSSTGKYLGILAAMALVLIVVTGVVGGGLWYWSQMGSSDPNEAGADPTPSVEESVEPTPEQTIEQTLPVEPTPDEANTNTEENDLPANSTPETDTGSTRTTPTRSTPSVRKTPVTRKTPVKKVTPKVRATKPPPKKTPKKDPGVL